MISIQEKKNCCGCSACASICPKHCISMAPDEEGFLYPKVDEAACIQCGLCEKACNELHPYAKRPPLQVLAAINKDENVRMRSSSGGIFYLLAEKTIREGGVVFGARFDERWQVVIDYAENMEGVEAFMGSKYVQARMDGAYVHAKRFLEAGRKVLFSGTPCQVAGLHKFLRKPYANLLTVDLVCHGTPSPKVWGMYLEDVVKAGQYISNVEFRNKRNGWKNFHFNLRYNEADKTISILSSCRQNHFMRAFLHDVILRPSCYACKARDCSSQSDITLADFWGINTIFPDMDDDKGTGMIFLNTEKGKRALDFSQIKYKETEYERVKVINPACYRSPKVHPKREEFFARLGNEDLMSLIENCTKPTFKQQTILFAFRCKALLKRALYKIGGGERKLIETKKPIQPTHLPSYPAHPKIVSVCFRNKEWGWGSYYMEIKVKIAMI